MLATCRPRLLAKGMKRTGSAPRRKSQVSGAQQPCVLALFSGNDLRLHDNYHLTLAVRKAQKLGLPLACAFCYDLRTFAQPSLVGGFFRQSPQRAQFLIDTVASLNEDLGREGGELLTTIGTPEEEVPTLAQRLNAKHCFAMTQHAPHEALVQHRMRDALRKAGCEFSTVWGQSTVHVDDLPRPFAEIPEGLRFFFDEFLLSTIRATEPFDCGDGRLRNVRLIRSSPPAAPSRGARIGPSMFTSNSLVVAASASEAPLTRGSPSLQELGYGSLDRFQNADTGSYGFVVGEGAALEAVRQWLEDRGGLNGYVYPGYKQRQERQDTLGRRAARVSPYIATGALSPRRFHGMIRAYAAEHSLQGQVGTQYQEALLRLARRDFWLFMGLKHGRAMFFPYGPTPEHTDDIPDYRFNDKIVRKWCAGLNGLPFCDAAMKELTSTGFTSAQGRQALAWLLAVGYGQDWRVGAEWMERCSLDYEPFSCYGEFARCAKLIRDDFGETVHSAQFLAHRHDQTGSYTRAWLPQLTAVPTMYIHRPHVLTERMQDMHSVKIGAGGNYPLPLKLWDGAQHQLGPSQLPAYFATSEQQMRRIPTIGEAKECGTRLLPEEQLTFRLRPVPSTDSGTLSAAGTPPRSPTPVGVPLLEDGSC